MNLTRWIGAAVFVVAIVVATALCHAQLYGGPGGPPPTPTPVPTPGAGTHQVIATPASGVYVGAHYNKGMGATVLETQMGRKLAMYGHIDVLVSPGNWQYSSFQNFQDITESGTLGNEGALGVISVLDWNCSGINATLIANGAVPGDHTPDATLIAQAQAMKAIPYPVIVRIWRENNLNLNGGTQNGNNCYTAGETVAQAQQEYINLFRHVVLVWSAQGVTNVTYVWAPNLSPANSSKTTSKSIITGFYPGSNFTDWVGFDSYNVAQGTCPGGPNCLGGDDKYTFGINNVILHPVQVMSAFNKPMAIFETGSCNDDKLGTGGKCLVGWKPAPNGQATYIADSATDLQSPGFMYQDVNAFMYYDCGADCNNYDWSFSGSGCPLSCTEGLQAFQTMLDTSFFNPSSCNATTCSAPPTFTVNNPTATPGVTPTPSPTPTPFVTPTPNIIVVSPAKLTYTGFTGKTLSVSESSYSSGFTIAINTCTGTATLSATTIPGGSGNITVTSVGNGSCVLQVTDASSNEVDVPVSVNVYAILGTPVFDGDTSYINRNISAVASDTNSAAVMAHELKLYGNGSLNGEGGSVDYRLNAVGKNTQTYSTNVKGPALVPWAGCQNPGGSCNKYTGSGLISDGTTGYIEPPNNGCGDCGDRHAMTLNTDSGLYWECYGCTWKPNVGPLTAQGFGYANLGTQGYITTPSPPTTSGHMPLIGGTLLADDLTAYAGVEVPHPVEFFIRRTMYASNQGYGAGAYPYVFPAGYGEANGTCSSSTGTSTDMCLMNGDIIALPSSFDCTGFTGNAATECQRAKDFGYVVDDEASNIGPRYGCIDTTGVNQCGNIATFWSAVNLSNFRLITRGTIHHD